MMDISVLDEAEIDNSSAVDGGEDFGSENVLDSDKDNIDVEMKELPDQLMESEVTFFVACVRFLWNLLSV